MTDNTKVYIAGMGMITPLGDSVEKTAAAVRAGISGYEESEYFGKEGKSLTMALLPEESLPEITYKLNNEDGTTLQMGIMLKATAIALKQAMQSYSKEEPIPLFLSTPEVYQNNNNSVSSKFIDYVIKQTNEKIDRKKSHLLRLGRAGVIDAIGLAIRYLHQVDSDYVLVGGAESYQDEDLLRYLDADDRLVSEGIMNGFVPGEAAGFLLLTKDASKAIKYDSAVISLSPPGIAQEKGHMYSDEPYRGDGLSEAFKFALSGYRGEKINKIYSSMNGEQFWAKEFGVALTRAKDFFADDFILEHPADCFGDTGAAAGALLIGLAAESLLKEKRKSTGFVYCSSDQAYRAAICVNVEQFC